MRQDYPRFVARDAEILAVGPDSPPDFQRYWREQALPFVGLADPKHLVANLYRQEVKLLKLGRLPALLVVNKAGQVRFQHYGTSMSDIPPNADLLSLLDQLNQEAARS